MAWRSVHITTPASLSCKSRQLVIDQPVGRATIPLEDIVSIVIDTPKATITSGLLSACAEYQVAVISVDKSHTPCGIFLPYLPHSRNLKVIRQQLAMTQPHKKRLWQTIIKQKLQNQADVLFIQEQTEVANKLYRLANRVKSGDSDNLEAYGAQLYFAALFGKQFKRGSELLVNAAINYGYAIVRSALARSLVSYGFLTAFGLHHDNHQNSFNLADDLMEPYRPLVDLKVIELGIDIDTENDLIPALKAAIASVIHQDAARIVEGTVEGESTLLTLADATVTSLANSITNKLSGLVLPGIKG